MKEGKKISGTKEMPQVEIKQGIPHVVIVGAGFGGLQTARAWRNAPVQVTVIDRSNYHLFQPLLYQVATADLSPADIAAPIRSILRKQANTAVMLAEVTGVDQHAQQVLLQDHAIPYDYLVIATGARHSYFGHDAWEPFAPGLKSLDDAAMLRRRILLANMLGMAVMTLPTDLPGECSWKVLAPTQAVPLLNMLLRDMSS